MGVDSPNPQGVIKGWEYQQNVECKEEVGIVLPQIDGQTQQRTKGA